MFKPFGTLQPLIGSDVMKENTWSIVHEYVSYVSAAPEISTCSYFYIFYWIAAYVII